MTEFRRKLHGFLRNIRRGTSFLIASHDEVVAGIHAPPTPARARRKPGALEGKIWMAPDFDSLPSDVLAAMEGHKERG